MIRDIKDRNDNFLVISRKVIDPIPLGERSLCEIDAVIALLMLRHQNPVSDKRIKCINESKSESPIRQPTPPPPADSPLAVITNTATASNNSILHNVPLDETPEERLNTLAAIETSNVPKPPTKHSSGTAERRSATPANNSRKARATKKTTGTWAQRVHTKSLLKSCRNMIREFLDNHDLK